MPGDEAECARRHLHRDVAIFVLVVEHGAIERDRGVGAERKIGAVRHHQPRGALEAGAHGFIAQHTVADTDLAGRLRRDAEDFFLDDDRLADARRRLGLGMRHRDGGGQKNNGANKRTRENVMTQLHFTTDRFCPGTVSDGARSRYCKIATSVAYQPDG